MSSSSDASALTTRPTPVPRVNTAPGCTGLQTPDWFGFCLFSVNIILSTPGSYLGFHRYFVTIPPLSVRDGFLVLPIFYDLGSVEECRPPGGCPPVCVCWVIFSA